MLEPFTYSSRKQAENRLSSLFKILTEEEKNLIELSLILRGKSLQLFEHSIEVACYMYNLSDYLNYQYEDKKSMFFAGLMHDIGKTLFTSNLIKEKPLNQLTAYEKDLIQKHSTIGFHILNYTTTDTIIKEVALNHHENINGTGYPSKTKFLSLNTEIAIVADCYSAIKAKRKYNRNNINLKQEMEKVKDNIRAKELVDMLFELNKKENAI